MKKSGKPMKNKWIYHTQIFTGCEFNLLYCKTTGEHLKYNHEKKLFIEYI